MNITFEKIDEILKILNIGKSFRIFGGIGLLISLWTTNELALKISLITFIFGALSRIVEMINKTQKIKDSILWQITFWMIFLVLYTVSINVQLNIFKFL
ncbi:MAG: hypothetical protein Q7U36_01810 [bacterium]|nr:hypothetical protein [bacterium]